MVIDNVFVIQLNLAVEHKLKFKKKKYIKFLSLISKKLLLNTLLLSYLYLIMYLFLRQNQ